MKSEVHVEILLEHADLDRIGAALGDLLPEGRVDAGRYEVRFRKSDPALPELLSALELHGVSFAVHEERAFRPREITEAVALHLEPQVLIPLGTATAAPFQGSCPGCGRGGEQVRDLVIEGPETTPNGFAITREGQLLVDEEVARAMIAGHISGCLLRGTRDAQGRPVGLFQVLPMHTLPPLCVPPTRIRRDAGAACPRCGEGGLQVASLLYYDLDSGELCDVNICREPLGGPGPAGGVVISQRLFRLLLERGALEALVEPVVLV